MRHEIEFVKCNPTQNMTVLVQTSHPQEQYEMIAAKIMSYENVHAEQVGFIHRSMGGLAEADLHMAGGEFCGNACMSLAAFLAFKRGLSPYEETRIKIKSSGTEHIVDCLVIKNEEQYECELRMPVPHRIEQKTLQVGEEVISCSLVRYRESIHIIIEIDELHDAIRNTAETIANLLGLTADYSLIGVLLYQSESHVLTPLMYVPRLGSMIWERGCGSGTASLGAYLSWKSNQEIDMKIMQPGGPMKVFASYNNELSKVIITGTVGIVAEGRAYIHD
ncbi:diaminopimelate epimerase [Neobacillus mesonae]|nr:diaminopimelate epimerase [Neobacillus mesonae]